MAGGMLLEVVLAIAVFAFGMLALVQLQGNLTRSSADANTRTVATNIAEEIVEDIRGYKRRTAIADNGEVEYLELVPDAPALNRTITRGGLDYLVTADVFDFWRDDANDRYVRTEAQDPPVPHDDATGAPAFASFKLLKIDVAWNTSQVFYVDDENSEYVGNIEDAPDTPYHITLYEIIPSSPPSLGAKIAADPNAPAGTPMVEFAPGLKPEIVALTLDGSSRFKESSTPTPDIIRSGELTETSFDVVSYNIDGSTSTFLRREEFVTVGCECTLNTSPDEGEGGLRPTVWNGVEYTQGEFVSKSFGEGANNQQSVFCDVCCRDHHDGGSGDTAGFEPEMLAYNPWNPDVEHEHYTRGKKGDLTPAKNGDTYVEACRLVRKEGFFRVAHDFNKQGYFGFPQDYLDNNDEIAEYSAYIVDAVYDLYGADGQNEPDQQTDLMQPGDNPALKYTNPATGIAEPYLPASLDTLPTFLPLLGSEQQQLRSRGIYIDYLSSEARAKIQLCINIPDSCGIPGYTTQDELALHFPFFEVQLTSLSSWREEIPNIPVHVTNDPIETNNQHSKGEAQLMSADRNESTVFLEIQEGNVGIAAVDPIVPTTGPSLLAAAPIPGNLYVETDGNPGDYHGTRVEGLIQSGVGGVRALDVVITFNEAQCGRSTIGYTCIYPDLAAGPTLTVSNYTKAGKTLYACSDGLDIVPNGQVTGDNAYTTFDLESWFNLYPDVPPDISIQDDPCGA